MVAKSSKKQYNKAMSKKLRQIVAIIALCFMLLFLASFMAYLINKELFNGTIGMVAIFFGVFTLAMYLVIVFDNKYGEEGLRRRAEQAAKEEEEARLKYLEEHPEEKDDLSQEQA